MDLDFTDEQEMLREMVRGVCAEHAPLDVGARAGGRPDRAIPTSSGSSSAELDLIGLMIPEEYGGSGHDAARGGDRLRGARPRAGAVAALRERGARAPGVLLRGGQRRAEARVAPAHRVAARRSSRPAWLEPRRRLRPAGRAADARRADGDGFVLDGVKRHVPFAARGRRGSSCSRAPATADATSTSSSSTRRAPGVTLDAADARIASDTQYEVDARRRARRRAATASAPPGRGWATWDAVMHDGIILLAAQAMGGAEHALEITVAVREGPRAVRQAARRVPGDLALPGRRVDRRSTAARRSSTRRRGRAPTGRSIARLAPMAKLFACQTYRDVTAMAQQVFGGVGFTLEYDIQLYFRRAKQLQISWWNDRVLEELRRRRRPRLSREGRQPEPKDRPHRDPTVAGSTVATSSGQRVEHRQEVLVAVELGIRGPVRVRVRRGAVPAPARLRPAGPTPAGRTAGPSTGSGRGEPSPDLARQPVHAVCSSSASWRTASVGSLHRPPSTLLVVWNHGATSWDRTLIPPRYRRPYEKQVETTSDCTSSDESLPPYAKSPHARVCPRAASVGRVPHDSVRCWEAPSS